jgi:hypothetical protein
MLEMLSWVYGRSHLSTSMCSESIKEVIVHMLERFLQRCPKDCAKNFLQRVDLLHFELELRGLNYQTPFYADCILKYREKLHHRGKKCIYYVAWCRISALFLTVTMCRNSLFLAVDFNFYESICIVSAHLILNLSERLCSLWRFGCCSIKINVQVLQFLKNSFPELPAMLIYISGFNGCGCIIE